jgi:hypothetical protein
VANRSPTTVPGDETLAETLSAQKPNVNKLEVFGCVAYANVNKKKGKQV